MYKVELTESYFPAQTDQELRETTVGSVLREAAGKWPDQIAVEEVDDDGALARTWTYSELLDDAERLANALLTRFVPGERIVVWSHNIPEWILCEYAFGLAGLVLVTANPGYQPRELKYVIEQSGSVGLFIVKGFRGNPMEEISREVASQIPAIREVTDMQDLDALFARGSLTGSLPEVVPSDIAQFQYTSGSTGFPKGVMLHHHGLTNNARHQVGRVELSPNPKALLIAPLFHTVGCALMVLGQSQCGGHLVVPRMFDPALANRLVESEKIQLVGGVPTMLLLMLEVDDQEPRDLTSIEIASGGGAMVAPELIKRIEDRFQCPFATGYGLTEASPLLSLVTPQDSVEDKAFTIGQPMPHVEISIRDPETNDVLPLDTVGEICSRGYNTMAGYNDNPEATAETIDADGWLHTGDLGRIDARGYLTITGRVKEMIIRGGENLFPAEIENVLLEHAAVGEVAVVGLPDEKWGEIVAAFIRPTEGADFDPDGLKVHCRELMAAQKTPSIWVAVDEYPKTGSGKIQKFELRDRYLSGEYGGG